MPEKNGEMLKKLKAKGYCDIASWKSKWYKSGRYVGIVGPTPNNIPYTPSGILKGLLLQANTKDAVS